jgi:hypothetical protein
MLISIDAEKKTFQNSISIYHESPEVPRYVYMIFYFCENILEESKLRECLFFLIVFQAFHSRAVPCFWADTEEEVFNS